MKSHTIIPTSVEHHMSLDEFIIATSDPTGRVTSVNDKLVDYSGYSREELMYVQHSLLRHPDMPRAVFWLARESLREGEDFYGYIKNLRKDGGFYWVFAHIRPEHDGEGEIVAYRSVRRAPRTDAIAAITEVYAAMRVAEHAAGIKEAIAAGLAVLSRYLGERNLSYEQLVARL